MLMSSVCFPVSQHRLSLDRCRADKVLSLMAPSFLDTFTSHHPLPFEVNGREHPVSRIFTLRFVEHLVIIKHILPCFFAGLVCAAPDPFMFKQIVSSQEGRRRGCYRPQPMAFHYSFQDTVYTRSWL